MKFGAEEKPSGGVWVTRGLLTSSAAVSLKIQSALYAFIQIVNL